MDISWDDARTFLAVAEAHSFSQAAERLGLGQPTISRRVAALEARLGCQLFTRGKQGAEVTEAGARLLPAAEQMARWAGEFGRLAQGAEERPEGIVRIAAPPGLAVEVLAPLAAVARDALPGIRLEVLASVDYVDLARGGADLAIRTRANREPELVTLHSARFAIGVFATAGYRARLLERLGRTDRDAARFALDELDWITWAAPYEQVAPRPMLERAIPDFRPAFTSDNYLVLKSALAEGLGVMLLERRGATSGRGDGRRDERLVELDLGFSLPESEYHLICAKSMRFVPRLRAVADLLMRRLYDARLD